MAASAASSSVCESGSSAYAVSEEKTNGTRLARLIVDVGTHVLRKILHSVHPPATLQQVLNNNLRKLQSLKSRHVIFNDQWEMIFPSSGDPPDSKTFDITLLHLLLREICHLTAPPTGWHKMPADGDVSLEANIVRIKCFRNELCHSASTGIPNGEFEDKWNKISSSLKELQASVFEKKIQDLKKDSIDHDLTQRVEEQIEQWKREHQDESEVMPQLHSCLPDKMPDGYMFGRTQEIKQVKDFVQSGTVAVVLITGGPGFGKTTVAKKVAQELTQSDNERTVLFCSLVTKRTFDEVATEMIHLCDRIHTHVPENPEQWLKDWSKQITTQVTFVLDNADGVLESKDRSSFLNMLRAVRMSSRQKVTFVVTSRKTFNDADLQPRVVGLKLVSVEEAKNILISRVSDQGVRLKLSRAEKIVELCGRVPLALCTVGSLLSDYTEERLIKQLEKQPLAVLQDDDSHERSMENAIKTSFDLLTQAEHKEAFVLMSVFSGPFDSDAAEAVMEARSIAGTLPDSILRSLKNRSLLEQPISRRYQMHPLIQAFAKKIGLAEYPHLVAAGEKVACAHFVSRLAENGNRYWSKDSCRESVEAFNADRDNFEYFLQIYAQGREEKESCQTFLDDLPQKCMYLQMCVLPRFYIFLLERLLEKFDSETQPVHRVEVLCLLGHEYRKAGENKKYQQVMMEADEVHKKNHAEFETNDLSEVYFRNSYVRFLSDKKDPNNAERIEKETEAVLQVSRDKLGKHPERAATLLYAGIFDKRRKKWDEAKQKLSKALELFKTCLGEHFMTAQSLKAIADLYFFIGRTETNQLDIGLAHYEGAIKIVDDLGMGGSKESILILKNFGICHLAKNNFEEAKKLLMKAEQVSERELEGNHPWKISIKTELAILHEKMGNQDQAKRVMLEGLRMGKRSNLPIDKMGNKIKIRQFIDRYPMTFTEEEFPRE